MVSTTVSTPQRSDPKLSEVARHLIIPDGIVTSLFPRIERRMAEADVRFDLWQRGVGQVSLGCRSDGKLAATVGGVVWSWPRQIGKTYSAGNLQIGDCLEFPGTRIAWTSHHNRTTTNTFRTMQGLVRRKKIWPHIAAIRTTNGEQEIAFVNGSLIMFGAREQGFGRGLDKIDRLIFDEAQILGLKALEDMVPATNQAQHPHGGLVYFMGTPPRPTDDGEAFTAKRERALSGRSTDQVFIELSAERDADPFDSSIYPTFNPSFPRRTPIEAMQRMLENIPDAESVRREMMGIWPVGGPSIFDLVRWGELANPDAPQPDRVVLTIAVSQDRGWSSIGVAGGVAGRTLVMCQSLRGLSQVAATVVGLKSVRNIAEVALVGDQAKALQPDLVKAGVEFETLTRADQGASCAAFQEAVKDGTVVHLSQPELDVAVGNAKTRFSGESEQWDRKDVKVDDSPLVACSAAFYRWGLLKDVPVEVWEPLWT